MNKVTSEISIIVSILKGWELGLGLEKATVAEVENSYEEFLNEIPDLSNFFTIELNKKYSIEIRKINDEKTIGYLQSLSDKSASEFFTKTYFKFSIIVSCSEDNIDDFWQDANKDSESKIKNYIRLDVVESLESQVRDILLYCDIAKPGVFYRTEYFVLEDNLSIKKPQKYESWTLEGLDLSIKYSWPPIKTLQVVSVYKWLDKIGPYDQITTNTKLGRAVAAFSHINDLHDKSYVKLIWALIGLETLYCTGTSGLKSQLLEKSEILLGERYSYKKNFSKMYDYRSRLVHGDLDIPYSNRENYSTEDSDKLIAELYEYELIAISMLLSTLQKMCSKSLYELKFKYQLIENNA